MTDQLEKFLNNLTTHPGVYSMLDDTGTVLYVGKAKNLKKRVTSYFRRHLDAKTLQLTKQIKSIEVTVTRNEREALLLESNLIKAQKPRYNILFRDDKTYPYLWLTSQDAFPRLSFYRGSRREIGKFYGPYPSAREARNALSVLQNLFRLRQCDNLFFKSRTRPCLQYQIKRCTAPCVGYISESDYQLDVTHARLFLEGKNQAVIKQLIHKMEEASEKLEFERAMRIRDEIAVLKNIQEQQIIMGKNTVQDIDVLGVQVFEETACVQVLVIREGKMLGSRQYFPNTSAFLHSDSLPQQFLEAFILQHYLGGIVDPIVIPKIILVSGKLENQETLAALLSEKSKRNVQIQYPIKGDRLKWVNMAVLNAQKALSSRSENIIDHTARFQALQECLQMEACPERLECFDISHTLGEATVASCVVFDVRGALKSDYRRFNIRMDTQGDDYAAMKEALTRRYTRLKSEGGVLPDVLLVDGGKGQLSAAKMVLEELQVAGVTVVAVAKGPTRKAGLETIYALLNGKRILVNPAPLALNLIQRIRDEAHRFAITAHRKKRAQKRLHSVLEDIPGIGKARRIIILKHFGGLQEVLKASMEELAKVPGINQALAQRIYEALHGQ